MAHTGAETTSKIEKGSPIEPKFLRIRAVQGTIRLGTRVLPTSRQNGAIYTSMVILPKQRGNLTAWAYWEQRIGYFDELLEKQNIGELEHRSMQKWSVQLIDYRCLARPDSPIHTKHHQPIPRTLHSRLVSNKSDFPSASIHQLHHFLIVLDAVYESIERVKKYTAMKKFGIPTVQCTRPFFLSCP